MMNEDAFYNATVVYRRDLHGELSIVRVRPDSGIAPDFIPGQFAMLGLPPQHRTVGDDTAAGASGGRAVTLYRRAYSITSTPAQKEWLEFYAVLVQRGRLTPRLWTVEQNGRVWLGPKVSGKFTLQPIPADRDLIMIATGTGIAPFLSMLRAYRGTGRWRTCTVVHGVRTRADLGFHDELAQLAAADASVFYLPTATREPADSGYHGHRGRPLTSFEDGAYTRLSGVTPRPDRCHIMVCGNPEMVESVQQYWTARGWSEHTPEAPGNLHFERYW